MPQIQLPIFPASSTPITSELAFQERDSVVWYFNGHLPVFSHPVADIASFRFFTSQLIANGNASQSEISRAFGVPLVSVKRACKKLRDEGAAGFFRPPVPRQGHKLTEQRLQEVKAVSTWEWKFQPSARNLACCPTRFTKPSAPDGSKKKP